MSRPPIRRSQHPAWRLVLLAIPAIVVCVKFFGSTESRLDPRRDPLSSGKYRVATVHDDATFDVLVPALPSGATLSSQFAARRAHLAESTQANSPRMQVSLLAVRIVQEEAAMGFLRSAIEGRVVELRFDRRRLNARGVMQAYVFVGDACVNEQLIQQAMAEPATHASDAGPMRRRLNRAQAP